MAKRRSTKKSARPEPAAAGPQRLNKVLAAAGLGSRRDVEELIVQGRVEIDREIVTDLACKVDPTQVTIKVDGTALKKSRPVYFALNKPKGVLSTNRDPSGRMRVIDLVPDRQRVFSVGRLDRNSEGLMLLTNDGELAQRLAHPKFRIQKTYFVVVSGLIAKEELAKLRKGVHLAEGFARIDGATIRKHRKSCTEIEIVLSEGKNREIRRILARAGHKVVLLRRIAIGPLRLGQLPVGASRTLTSAEVHALYAATDPATRNKKSTKGKSEKATGLKRRAAKPTSKKAVADDENDLDEHLILDDEEFEAYDDDFVGDFSGSGRVGSVLAYDESTAAPKDKRRSRTSSRSQTKKPVSKASRRRAASSSAASPRKAASTKRKPAKKSSAAGRSQVNPSRRQSGGKAEAKRSVSKSRGSRRGKGR